MSNRPPKPEIVKNEQGELSEEVLAKADPRSELTEKQKQGRERAKKPLWRPNTYIPINAMLGLSPGAFKLYSILLNGQGDHPFCKALNDYLHVRMGYKGEQLCCLSSVF